MQPKTGITLIALIITIVILIILAGVTLNITLGENGILNKSKNAVDKYQEEAQKEQSELNKAYAEINKAMGEPSYIPEGFIHLEGTIEEGYVIQNETTGDEFVWIPVETPVAEDETELSTLNAEGKYPMAVKTEGTTNGLQNYRGVLYDFDINKTGDAVTITPIENSETGYREPAVVSDYDGTSDDTVGITQDLLQGEYNELVASVIANKGFYIGRYESGNLSGKAVSKKGETEIASQTWYQMYTSQKNIYEDSGSTKTHMIWGSQYDQVLIWMKDIPNTSENAKENPFYVLNSVDMGNYKNSTFTYTDASGAEKEKASGNYAVIPTGSTETSRVKNVYDLAGNVYDWTMESDVTYYRVLRGGSFIYSGSDRPASYRVGSSSTYSYTNLGSRLTLYK